MLNILHTEVENRKIGLRLEFHYGEVFLARVGQLDYFFVIGYLFCVI